MANATTHPADRVLKMIAGLYGKGKRREDWVGVKKGNLNIHGVIKEVAISFVGEFRVRRSKGIELFVQ